LNRNSLSFNIYTSDLNDTDLHKETLVFKRICTTSLKSSSKNRDEVIPAFPKYPCNEQAVITIMPLLGRPPQDEKWSLKGGILGGNINILDTADRPAAWPALNIPLSADCPKRNHKKSFFSCTRRPAYIISHRNEQIVTHPGFHVGHWPQVVLRSLRRGPLRGTVYGVGTSEHSAAWPARKKSNRPFLLCASLPTAPQRVAFIPHTTTFFAQANGHLSAISPPPHKTALLADKAELVTTGTCFQSGSVSCFDLADGAAADSAFFYRNITLSPRQPTLSL